MGVPEEFISSLCYNLERQALHLDEFVIEAFRRVDRKYFVGKQQRDAYKDNPLPIPAHQTISAPHMYALMMAREIADLDPSMDILEIGTGSGYGAALLAASMISGSVFSIERIPELFLFAKDNIQQSQLDLPNLHLKIGDGTELDLGIEFDRILVTAAGPSIPPSYKNHLKPDGRIIMPLDYGKDQWLVVITYKEGKEFIEKKFRVRFVPLIGTHGHN